MIQFGTGGWRAVIGSDFIEKNICLVTEGICALMKEEGKTDKPIIGGYDHRFLSDVAAKWSSLLQPSRQGSDSRFCHRLFQRKG